jgi:tetratricopeptide (TPR) repeat protein
VSRSEAKGDCIGCHMTKARAYDGGHTVFTDHSIRRRPAGDSSAHVAPATLTSYFPADPASSTAIRNQGIAWAEIAETYNTYAKVGEALDSASKTAEAEKIYRLSLEQDPQQLDVLLRLAALLERSGKHTEAAELRKRAASILPRQSE